MAFAQNCRPDSRYSVQPGRCYCCKWPERKSLSAIRIKCGNDLKGGLPNRYEVCGEIYHPDCSYYLHRPGIALGLLRNGGQGFVFSAQRMKHALDPGGAFLDHLVVSVIEDFHELLRISFDIWGLKHALHKFLIRE